jgi:uncharacterized protein YndB with AHSA1/START domain
LHVHHERTTTVNPTAIERDILIDAPADVVWAVITRPEGITQWFSDAAELDLRPGGSGSLTFTGHGTVPLRVEVVRPPHLFSFRWEFPEGEQPSPGNSLLVEFTLTPEGDGTRLRVVETGFDDRDWTPDTRTAYVDDHTQGWTEIVGKLGRLQLDASGVRASR